MEIGVVLLMEAMWKTGHFYMQVWPSALGSFASGSVKVFLTASKLQVCPRALSKFFLSVTSRYTSDRQVLRARLRLKLQICRTMIISKSKLMLLNCRPYFP